MSYSTVTELRTAVCPDVPAEGFDNPPPSPTHTAADLSNATLVDAIAEADSTIDSYLANRYVTPVADVEGATPHPIDFWSRNIAAYSATLTFRKGKDLSDQDPVARRFAMTLLQMTAVRDGKSALPLPELTTVGAGAPMGAGDATNPYYGRLWDQSDFDLEADQGLGSLPLHGNWWRVP